MSYLDSSCEFMGKVNANLQNQREILWVGQVNVQSDLQVL
jgi:hypothetical protein